MMGPLISTLILLLAPSPAAAEETLVLQQGVPGGLQLQAQVAVMKKPECLEYVNRALQPMALIRQGIQALAEMNHQEMRQSSCLDEFDRTLAPELSGNHESSSGFPDIDELSKALDRAMREIEAQERCSNSPDHVATANCLRLFSQEEIAQSRKKEEAIRARLKSAYLELSILPRSTLAIAPSPPRNAELVGIESQMQFCAVEAEPGTPAFASHLEGMPAPFRNYCQDKWATPSAIPALKARMAALKLADDQLTADWIKRYPRITPTQQNYLILLQTLLAPPERSRVSQLVQKAVCYNPYPPGSSHETDWLKMVGSACEGITVDEATAAAARETLRSELPTDDKIEEILSQESARQSSILKDARARAQRQVRDSVPTLRLRLLTSRFHHAAARSRGVVDADKFCADYEAAQNQDLQSHQMNVFLLLPQRENHWQALPNFGLTLSELSAVADYTGSRYAVINRALFEPAANRRESDSLYADFLNRTLERLPAYRSGVSRAAELPPNVLAAHQPGAIVTYPAFTSTSRKSDWNWPGSHRFVIYGANGRMVEQASHSPGEEEVLFRSGTRFKVLSREEKPDGRVHFVMAEVDANGQVIGHPPSQ